MLNGLLNYNRGFGNTDSDHLELYPMLLCLDTTGPSINTTSRGIEVSRPFANTPMAARIGFCRSQVRNGAEMS